MRWFDICWHKYLFTNLDSFQNFICRIKNHPNGVVYFNAGGFEPDYSCKDCGEDLG